MRCSSGKLRARMEARATRPMRAIRTMPAIRPMLVAWMPPPAASMIVEPVTVIKRRPTPGVSGDKGPAPVGIVAPGAVVEGTPVRANSVGLPAFTVAGHVRIIAVVAEIGYAGGVGILAAGVLRSGGGVLIVIAVALLIPGVFGLRGNVALNAPRWRAARGCSCRFHRCGWCHCRWRSGLRPHRRSWRAMRSAHSR